MSDQVLFSDSLMRVLFCELLLYFVFLGALIFALDGLWVDEDSSIIQVTVVIRAGL